ncbi:MAG: beta-lactamase family protein, partial [Lachnospiraceae bacterium]|nr:beta-lactamase family protein [Lachnospiraceae bacterium]
MKKKVLVCFLSVLCLFMLPGVYIPAKAEVIHEIDLEEYILKEMSEAHVMSMAISIVSPEREVYCASYGSETQTDRDYVLGELTQSFTAAAIMHLSEDSEISLDDTVGHYLADEKYQAVRDVKISELLNQTSGISLYETMSEITRSGTRGQFEAAPVNYNILGEIIEHISGVPYEEYVADNILDPLEMESTHSLRNNAEFSDEMVPGFRYYFGFPFETDNDYDESDDWMQVSSSLMVSDVKDMGKYLQMYLQNGGEILSDDRIALMLDGKTGVASDARGIVPLFDGATSYGMGWLSVKVDGKQVCYYTGKSKNSTAGMFLLPEQKLGIAILFNSADYSGQRLLEKLEKGIISIELESTAEEFQTENYFQHNILADIGIVLLVLAAWMPIFLISVWGAGRRRKLFRVFGIFFDICIHLILPTVLLYQVQERIPFLFLYRLYPDNFFVVMAIAGGLYLGAVIKIIAMIVFAILGPKPEEEAESASSSADSGETEKAGETIAEQASGKENTPESRETSETKKEEKETGEEKEDKKSRAQKEGTKEPQEDLETKETIVRRPSVKEVKPLEDSVKEVELKIPPVKREKDMRSSVRTAE